MSDVRDIVSRILESGGALVEPMEPDGLDSRRHASQLEDLVRGRVVLENATFRFQDAERSWTEYLVLFFHLAAVSDEKRTLLSAADPGSVLAAIRERTRRRSHTPAPSGSTRTRP